MTLAPAEFRRLIVVLDRRKSKVDRHTLGQLGQQHGRGRVMKSATRLCQLVCLRDTSTGNAVPNDSDARGNILNRD